MDHRNPASIAHAAEQSLPAGAQLRATRLEARTALAEIIPKGYEHRLLRFEQVLQSVHLRLIDRAFSMGIEHALTPPTP